MSEAAFLQAIRDGPEDDAVRLIFADWLDEQGDPRGELIRLQVGLARTDEQDDNHLEWTVRSERWLNEHGDRWLSRLPQDQGTDPWIFRQRLTWHFRRGLPEYLEAEDLAHFRQVKEASVASTALVAASVSRLSRCKALAKSRLLLGLRELRLHNSQFYDPGLEDLALSLYLSTLTTLILDDNRITSAGCRALADSPNLPGLVRLEVYRNPQLGDEGARILCRSRHLARLERLTLSASSLGTATAEALAGSDLLANLRELDLSHNHELANAGAVALARSGRLEKLEKLNLCGCGLTSRGVRDLARGALPALRRLDLSQNGLNDQALRALASASYLSQLTELRLGYPDAGAEGIRALAEADLTSLRLLQIAMEFDPSSAEALAAFCSCPQLKALVLYGPDGRVGQVLTAFAGARVAAPLTELHLSQADIGDRGAQLLAGSPALPRLRILELWGNKIGPAGAKALGTSAHLKELRKLRLSFNQLGDEGVAELVSSPSPPPLIWLDLQSNGIGDDGVRALVNASDRLPGLSHLNLSSNRVSDDGVVLLAQSPLLARLTKLDLRANQITDRGAEALLKPALNNRGLYLQLNPGYDLPLAGYQGPGLALQARLRQALARRVEFFPGVMSW
jgi:uncharacterized protein (TIGR02996 family)